MEPIHYPPSNKLRLAEDTSDLQHLHQGLRTTAWLHFSRHTAWLISHQALHFFLFWADGSMMFQFWRFQSSEIAKRGHSLKWHRTKLCCRDECLSRQWYPVLRVINWFRKLNNLKHCAVVSCSRCCTTTSNCTVPVNKQPDEEVTGNRFATRFAFNWIGQWIVFINSANIYFVASGLNSLLSYGFLLLHTYCSTLFTQLLCIAQIFFNELTKGRKRPLNNAIENNDL